MAKKRIDVEIGVKNKVAAGLKNVKASMRKFSRSVKSSLSGMGLSFKRLALVAAGSFAAMIKHGNDFRTSMAEVQTMLGSDKSMLPKLTKQVRDLSAEFGLAKDTLAKGLYQALSAGVPANNSIDFLRVASKAAVGGVTDVATTVDGLTSVLNAYGIEASKVAQVSDLMFSVVKEGKINFEELSQNIGNIAPFAKVAGVGIEDLSAMIATLVKVDKPERAMTSLRQAMVFAAKEGKPLLQVLNEFEGKSLEDLLKAGVTQKSAAGIAIMSGNMSVLRKEMEIFKNTAGAANDAFQDVAPVKHWQRIWQSILLQVSRVGEYIDSNLSPYINRLSAYIMNMGNSPKFDAFLERVQAATKTIAELVVALSGAEGGEKRTQTFKALGNILSLSLLSGAQHAVNIMHKGLLAAWDAFNNNAMEGFKTYGKMLINPLYAAKKYGEFSGRASVSGGKVAKDLVDTSLTEKRLEGAIEGLNKLLNDKSASPSVVVAPTYATKNGITPKLGIGGMGGGSNGGTGLTQSTSMLSTGDLFTMMQTGGAAKRDSELSELQAISSKMDTLIDVSGGIV